MILVDHILLFPARGLLWVFHEIASAAQQELADEAENITSELSELYMRLETGQITEPEFDVREKELLDRLDEIQERETVGVNGEDEEEGDNGRWSRHSAEPGHANLLAETNAASSSVRR